MQAWLKRVLKKFMMIQLQTLRCKWIKSKRKCGIEKILLLLLLISIATCTLANIKHHYGFKFESKRGKLILIINVSDINYHKVVTTSTELLMRVIFKSKTIFHVSFHFETYFTWSHKNKKWEFMFNINYAHFLWFKLFNLFSFVFKCNFLRFVYVILWTF